MTALEKYYKIRCKLMEKYFSDTADEDTIVQGGTERIIYTGDPAYPYAEITFKPLTLEIGQERIRYITEREICRTNILTDKAIKKGDLE